MNLSINTSSAYGTMSNNSSAYPMQSGETPTSNLGNTSMFQMKSSLSSSPKNNVSMFQMKVNNMSMFQIQTTDLLNRPVKPVIYRVYQSTVQRVAVSVKNLNSNASFVIVVEADHVVILWVGSDCAQEDAELAEKICETVVTRDFRMDENEDAITTIIEGQEDLDQLDNMLDLLWTTSNIYFSKNTAKDRKKPLVNSAVSVGLIEPVAWADDVYDYQETAFAYPDAKGVVPRVTFPPIEMKTIAYVNVGEHWDVWCSRAVSDEEVEKVMVFVRSTVATHLNLSDNAATKQFCILSQFVHLVRQGDEDTLFRRPLKIFTDYEPPGKCAPRPDPAPKMRREVDRKTQELLAKQAADVVKAAKTTVVGDLEEEDIGNFGGNKSDANNSNINEDLTPPQPTNFWSVKLFEGNNNDTSLSSAGQTLSVPTETVVVKDKNAAYGLPVSYVIREMLLVSEAHNETPDVRRKTVDESVENPRSLIGYQVLFSSWVAYVVLFFARCFLVAFEVFSAFSMNG
jgi:hypothetical protein